MGIVSRAHLVQAVREEAGLTHRTARSLVETLIDEIASRLVAGEEVKLYGFGSFAVRDKTERPGRNPRTLEAAPIAARRVVVFRASKVLKKRIAESLLAADTAAGHEGDARHRLGERS